MRWFGGDAADHNRWVRGVGDVMQRLRVGVETAVAALAGLLAFATVFWHDWIEALTGWDPDHHNGALEWLIIVALLAVAVAVGLLARRNWRALAPAAD